MGKQDIDIRTRQQPGRKEERAHTGNAADIVPLTPAEPLGGIVGTDGVDSREPSRGRQAFSLSDYAILIFAGVVVLFVLFGGLTMVNGAFFNTVATPLPTPGPQPIPTATPQPADDLPPMPTIIPETASPTVFPAAIATPAVQPKAAVNTAYPPNCDTPADCFSDGSLCRSMFGLADPSQASDSNETCTCISGRCTAIWPQPKA